MPIQSIEPKRLYRQIADQLRRLIERGEFAGNARLPPERDLAAQLGVSRPTVREALIALEVEGLVEVRMGSGIYVLPRAQAEAAAAPARLSADGPFEIIAARQLIEGELAAVAARRMNPGQLAGLRHALRVMSEEARRGVMPTRGDRLFHVRLAEASDNTVLARLVAELYDERDNPLFAKFGSHFENAANWQRAIEEHAAVVEAVAAKDEDGARRAMRHHLQSARDRFAANLTAPAEGTPAEPTPPAPLAAGNLG